MSAGALRLVSGSASVPLATSTLVTTERLKVPETDLYVVTVGLGDHHGEAVHRLHHGQPLDELAAHR